mgnify:CR=1 FL=1
MNWNKSYNNLFLLRISFKRIKHYGPGFSPLQICGRMRHCYMYITLTQFFRVTVSVSFTPFLIWIDLCHGVRTQHINNCKITVSGLWRSVENWNTNIITTHWFHSWRQYNQTNTDRCIDQHRPDMYLHYDRESFGIHYRLKDIKGHIIL